MNRLRVGIFRSALLIAGFLLVGSGAAWAGPLGLGLPGFPDIMVQDLAINYDATTMEFTATGDASASYSAVNSAGNPVLPLTGLSYNLTAKIDHSGNLIQPGSLDIKGNLGSGIESLLAGKIFQFGYDPLYAGLGAANFEFLLSVTDSAPQLGFGTTAGVILSSSPNSLPLGYSFNGDFRGAGIADNFTVPEPASFGLLLLGAAGAAYRRRRR